MLTSTYLFIHLLLFGRSNASSGCEIPLEEDMEMKIHRMFYKFATNNYVVDVFEMLSIPFVPPPGFNRNCDQEDLSHVLGEIQSSLDQISTELRGLRYQIEINKINAHFNKCYQLKTNLQLTRKHSNETDPLRPMFEGDLREQCGDENPIGAFTLLNRDTTMEMLTEIADYDNATYIQFKESMKLNLAFCLLVMQQCHRVTKATHDHHQRQSHYKSLFNEVDREVNSLMVKFRNADRKSANNYGHIAFGIIKATVVFPEKTESAWTQLKSRQPLRAWAVLCTPFSERAGAFRFESINGIMRNATFSRWHQTCLALSVRKGKSSSDTRISPYKNLNLTTVHGFETIQGQNDLFTTMAWLKAQIVEKNQHQHVVILVVRHHGDAHIRYETGNFDELEMRNEDRSISQRILIGWDN